MEVKNSITTRTRVKITKTLAIHYSLRKETAALDNKVKVSSLKLGLMELAAH